MTTRPPDPLQGSYDPRSVEARWYPIWEGSGAFRPEVNPDGEPFCIVIPPPNVTGVLHIGHALDHSIQDAIIRRKRMQGYATLWLPGTDHAGIATQMVVERELALEGLSRHSMGRKAFVEQVWQWKRQSGGTITAQMRALGDSCDWTRERFTLDEGLSAAVSEVFVRLHEKGLIYRGQRIINWSPGLMTAISDIEVEYREVDGRLVHITYPFADGDGEGITVATTRAETMLGDTGVAVHPGDDRYRHLVGRTVRLPLMGRDIPVVADEAVEPDFGTGAVKVTPAHDPLDFDISLRAGLVPVQVIGEDGRMTAAAGDFAGLDRFEARAQVVEALRPAGTSKASRSTAIRWATAPAAACPSSRSFPTNGSCGWRSWSARRWRWCRKTWPGSFPSVGNGTTSAGWRTSRTGASADSSGGVIGFRPGTAKPMAR